MKKVLYAALIVVTAIAVYHFVWDLWEFELAHELVNEVKQLMSN